MKRKSVLTLLGILTLSLMLIFSSCGGDSNETQHETPGEQPPKQECTHKWVQDGTSFPTCTEDGTENFFCPECGERKSTTLPATGHAPEVIPAVDSTCTEDGVTEGSYCTTCGITLVEPTCVEAPGHKIVEDKGYAPTCTEDGLTDGTHCEVCKKTVTEQYTVYAPGHTLSWTDEIPPTCTEDGRSYSEHCTVCGEVFAEEVILPAPGHTLVTVEGFAATCTENGLTDGSYCEVCEETVTEQKVITAPGHKMVFEEKIEPTCMTGGRIGGIHCETCSAVFSSATDISPVAHSIVDGKCVYCKITVTAGLAFAEINEGKAYALIGRGSASDAEIVVPPTYNEKPVLKVASGAFAGDSNLTSVTVTGGITTIEADAFKGCGALKDVILSASVTEIEANAFADCASLTAVKCADFEQSYGWDAGWCGDSETDVIANRKDGKTPYQVYLEAMSVLNDNCDRFKMHEIRNMDAYIDDIRMGEASSRSEYFYEAAGIYSTYQYHVAEGIKIWYYNGYLYQIANGEARKMSASPEYMREMINTTMAKMPVAEEKLFENATFIQKADGSYLLTLVMSPEHLTEIIEDILGTTGDKMNGAYISACTYSYVYDREGNLSKISTDATIVIPKIATNSNGEKVDMVAYMDDTMSFSEVGTLQQVTAPTGSFTDVSYVCPTHFSSNHVTVPGYAATCDKEGLTDGVYCKRCYSTVTESKTIPATGHTPVGGVCTECGALDGASEDLEYVFKADGKTCTVVGIGGCIDSEIVIPESIHGVAVTAIGSGAFTGYTRMTSITIPPTVKTVGEDAFYGCTSLVSATLPTHLLKYLPSSVTSVTLNGGESIAKDDLTKLVSLRAITLHEGLTSIEGEAFAACKKLTAIINHSSIEITLGDTSANGGIGANAQYITTPDSQDELFVLGDLLFKKFYGYDRAYLMAYLGDGTEVILPKEVLGLDYHIDGDAFVGRGDITSLIALSEPILSGYEFDGLTGLVSVNGPGRVVSMVPNGSIKYVTVTSGEISERAFYNSTVLESLVLKNGVESIGDNAFSGCTSLKSVSVPGTVESIAYNAFEGCSALSRVTLAEGILGIGQSAFANCPALTEITVPDSVTSIGRYIFSNSGVKYVTLGDGITYLPERFIEYCSVLTLTLGTGITEMHESAIYSTNLFEIINNSSFDFGEDFTDIMIHSGESLITYIDGYAFYLSDEENILLGYVGGSDRLVLPTLDGGKTYTVRSNAFHSGYNYNYKYTYLSIPNSVTKLESGAFYGLMNISEIYFNANVTAAWEAFSNCGRYLPDTSTADCALVIGNNVTSIPGYMFVGSRISSLSFEKGAKCSYIGGHAFERTGLTVIEIPESIETVEGLAFECYDLREIIYNGNATAVSHQVFRMYPDNTNNNPLVKLTIGKDATDIPAFATYLRINELAFEEGCKLTVISHLKNQLLLESITLPSSVTEIGTEAFSGCTALKSVTISDGIERINDKAFYGCTALEEVNLPKKSFVIGVDVFYGTKIVDDQQDSTAKYVDGALVSVSPSVRGEFTVREGTRIIAVGAFKGLTGITAVTLPEGLTVISSNAFSGCTNLVTVNMPSTLSVIGSSAFYGCQKLSLESFPASLSRIEASAFSGCVNLSKITLPDSLTHIGASAFSGCSYLKEISVPNFLMELGANAFENCTAGTYYNDIRYIGNDENPYLILIGASAGSEKAEYVIESGVKFIHSGAFSAYKVAQSVTSITIPEGVISIGDRAFSGCRKLTEINLPSTLTEIGIYAFNDCRSIRTLTIPSSVTAIKDYTFRDCIDLESVKLPSGITEIGNYAFSYCTSLSEIALPSALSTVGVAAFDNCTSLAKVTFDGNSVTDIGDSAFYGCTALETVSLPDSVVTIGNGAFGGCISLKEIRLPASLDTVPYDLFANCTSLKAVHIPSAKRIGESAFYNCTALETVVLPDSLIGIGYNAFLGCTALRSLIIPDSVNAIGDSAFKDCTALESITLPKSLTHVANSVFSGCSALKEVLFPANVEELGYSIFSGCTSLVKLEVAPENTYLASDGNCIYQRKNNKIILALSNTPLPESEEIAKIDGTFIENGEEWTLTLHDGITSVNIHNSELLYLTEIHIGAGVRSLTLPFDACPNLRNITVSENNEYFYVSEGGLYKTSNNSLVFDFN